MSTTGGNENFFLCGREEREKRRTMGEGKPGVETEKRTQFLCVFFIQGL